MNCIILLEQIYNQTDMETKKILGLDLGVTSIGWALVQLDNEKKILGMGSRIIPYDSTEGADFGKGKGESKNQQRTAARTARKTLDRYQLRRKYLYNILKEHLLPTPNLFNLSAIDLYALRAKAATERISLAEIGRLFLLLNQKRGYKHGTEKTDTEKTQREYVEKINTRYAQIRNKKTIGQFFYEGLQNAIENNGYYRIKEQIFPREAYIAEFNTIWDKQQTAYPEILTENLRKEIRDIIIYYQRPLKSQKGLLSTCEFEGFWVKDSNGKDIFAGPKVAAKSNPVFQLCKIWESIHNITIKQIVDGERRHVPFDISPFKQEIFTYLNTHEKLSETDLFKICNIKKGNGYYADRIVRAKGIQGNLTLCTLLNALEGCADKDALTMFNLKQIHSNAIDKATGEVLEINVLDAQLENEPLYKLWHTCYAEKDATAKLKALQHKFDLPIEFAEKLTRIDFARGGYGNKSTKAMRKILPYLMEGHVYSTAMNLVGYNHSFSETKEDLEHKELKSKLTQLTKNSLRQPIVEKILNQLINVVNAIIEKYGRPDEIRIELARELKMSKEERNDYSKNINQKEEQTKKIIEKLEKDYNLKATRKNIEKWRLWHEVNGICLYCGKQINLEQFLSGIESDVEHIVPKALLYDDSFTNKTIAHIACNSAKTNTTAYDFMVAKGDEAFGQYTKHLESWYNNDKTDKAKTLEGAHTLVGKIGKRKFERFYISYKEYVERKKIGKETDADKELWENFISRQLNETRYIARKAKEILSDVCRYVYSSSGNITSHVRKLWGWENAIMNLHLPTYREHDLTFIDEWKTDEGVHKIEKIKDWSKRDDHRHHAVDALAIACTTQGMVQRLNTLNAQHTKEEMLNDIKNYNYKEKLSTLEKWLIAQKPFDTKTVEDEVSKIFISFKAGKKVATIGTRKISKRIDGKKKKIVVQENIVIPRGKLSEESVYGKIKTIHKDYKKDEIIKHPIKYLFENSELIFNAQIKQKVQARILQHEGNIKNAIASLKKQPIYIDKAQKVDLQYGSCYTHETVLKYPISTIAAKDLPYIVDGRIKQIITERLAAFNNKEKEAFKTPLYYDEEKSIPITTVRVFTCLTAVATVKRNDNKEPIGYGLPKNNHHIALYKNEAGEIVEHTATFWHCVERKQFFINNFTKEELMAFQENTIIKNPSILWNKILNLPEDKLNSEFLESLPKDNWEFITSLQRNEMFVIGMEKDILVNAINNKDVKNINQFLYRINSLATKNYNFRRHIETKIDDKYNGEKNELLSKRLGRLIIIQSIDSYLQRNPIKVNINNLGEISLI